MNLPTSFNTPNANLSAYALVGSIIGQPGHSTHPKVLPTTKRERTHRDVRNAFSSTYYKGANHAQ